MRNLYSRMMVRECRKDLWNSAEKGSGIGLAVVREIILGHGGTIRAENRGGLAVIVTIPVID